MRHGNTAVEMTSSGSWVKVGKKHYQHISGAEVKYDCNAWGWVINGGNMAYSSLWAAKYEVEKNN